MKKIKYLVKRVLDMDFKNIKEELAILSKKSGISQLKLMRDILKCSMKYKTGFNDYKEFEFYLMSEAERETFITSGINKDIVRFYNNIDYRNQFEDKAKFYKKFKAYISRDFVDLREIEFNEFETFIRNHKQVVVKVLDEVEGFGVTVIDYEDKLDKINYKDEYQRLISKKQYLMEEYFIQHHKMQELSVKSVNTLRIITLLDDKGDVIIMNQVLKAGLDGFLDNYGQGGMYTVLSEDGRVVRPFVDKQGNSHIKHPTTGYDFIGFEVPYFDQCLEKVKLAAKEIPEVRYVGWDCAIGESHVEIIEGNYYSYPFQVIPSISNKVEGLLPYYKSHMTELFDKKEKVNDRI